MLREAWLPLAQELAQLRCQCLSTREALKILVRRSPALPSPTYHNYILFPRKHVLDIHQFHFQPTPHPTGFPVLVSGAVFSLGEQGEVFGGGHPSASMLPGSGTTG